MSAASSSSSPATSVSITAPFVDLPNSFEWTAHDHVDYEKEDPFTYDSETFRRLYYCRLYRAKDSSICDTPRLLHKTQELALQTIEGLKSISEMQESTLERSATEEQYYRTTLNGLRSRLKTDVAHLMSRAFDLMLISRVEREQLTFEIQTGTPPRINLQLASKNLAEYSKLSEALKATAIKVHIMAQSFAVIGGLTAEWQECITSAILGKDSRVYYGRSACLHNFCFAALQPQAEKLTALVKDLLLFKDGDSEKALNTAMLLLENTAVSAMETARKNRSKSIWERITG